MHNYGNILLLDRDETIINRRAYMSPSARRKVIAEWRKWYGKRFNNLILHVIPKEEGSLRTHKNGTNFKHSDTMHTLHARWRKNRTGSGKPATS